MEVKRIRCQMLLCWAVVGLWSCAQISAPTGGPKDETPPQVLLFEPANGQVNSRPDQLSMEFDEYVVVRNVQKQLIISPPIASTPAWRVRGKVVEWTLDPSEFEEDRTYIFSFGTSIVDLHESNPATDLKWAFSTGSILDTLKVQGRVTDQMTGQGKKGLRILLFQEPVEWDSIWAGQRPDAVGESNSEGTFAIPYLADRSFVGFALEDVNSNYVWDPGEYIALDSTPFRPGMLELAWLGAETEKAGLRPTIGSCRADTTGMIRTLASASKAETEAEDWEVIGSDKERIHWEREGDSVFIWMNVKPEMDWQETRLVWSGLDFSDTARIRLNNRVAGLENWNATIQPRGAGRSRAERVWRFQRGLHVVDSTKFRLLADSVECPIEFIRASSAAKTTRELHVGILEEDGVDYHLEVFPGGLRNRAGGELRDTLVYEWKTHPAEYYGELVVKLTDLPGVGWLRLDDERVWISSDSAVRFERLEPKNVTLGFEWDMNGDSIWQSVEPEALQSAEPYFFPKSQPKVRSNWIIEWDWEFQSEMKVEGEESEK